MVTSCSPGFALLGFASLTMWQHGHANRSVDGESDEVASSYAVSHSGSEHVGSASLTPQRSDRSDKSDDDSYSDDDFDKYSDEFEQDDGGDIADERPVSEALLLRVSDLVQIFWDDEGAWFDGTIAHMDAQKCFVHYADGEQQWEPVEGVRPAPPSKVESTQQLQLVADTPGTFTDQRVLVYWPGERNWFKGWIAEVSVTSDKLQSIHVFYDDGDDQWIMRAAFRDVLLLGFPAGVASNHQSHDHASTVHVGAERVLTPRKYTPVVSTHFEPIRVARPYRCTVRNHIGSIVTARRADELHRPFYARVDARLDFKMARFPASDLDQPNVRAVRECEIQTDITADSTSSA